MADQLDNPDDIEIVITTVPDSDTAKKIAASLVEKRLAACVNIIPGLISVYRWKSDVRHDNELLLVIKTTKSAYLNLVDAVLELHPYELPEIIALPIDGGLEQYLQWIRSEVVE